MAEYGNVKLFYLCASLALALAGERLLPAQSPTGKIDAPTFYRDVLPIVQQHCQPCHRPGEIAPMPFMTYAQVKPWAPVIKKVVSSRTMPPWFADRQIGHFSNDPSLAAEDIERIVDWVDRKAPPGEKSQAPPPRQWVQGWKIAKPDVVLQMPTPIALPATGDVDYQYVIVPTGFKEDHWVQMSEVRPTDRSVVHHAVVYVREPGSKWLRRAPAGKAFSTNTLTDEQDRKDSQWTDSDVLLVYSPGSTPDQWPAGTAKFIPAGADLVFQVHYQTNGKQTSDQSRIGLVFATAPTKQRVLTLQLTNDRFLIPPNVPDHRVSVHGTLPNQAKLLSFFPHMHLRGKSFEYKLRMPGKPQQTVLRVPQYDFHWQLTYRLAQPLTLPAGSDLEAMAIYDNSTANHHNPDPDSAVRWGEQSWEEMMVGFFDVAVDASMTKQSFFIRTPGASARVDAQF